MKWDKQHLVIGGVVIAAVAILLLAFFAPSKLIGSAPGDLKCSEITNRAQCSMASSCPESWNCLWNPNVDECACYRTCEEDTDCQENFKCVLNEDVDKKVCKPKESSTASTNTETETLSLQGDFEGQISSDCWGFVGSPQQNRGITPDAHGGTHAVFIQNMQANSSYWTTEPACYVPAEGKKDYTFSAWIKTEKEDIGDMGAAYLKIEFLNSTIADEPLKTESSDNVKAVKEGEWTQVKVEKKSPEGTVYVVIKLVMSGTGVAKFDDLAGSVSY